MGEAEERKWGENNVGEAHLARPLLLLLPPLRSPSFVPYHHIQSARVSSSSRASAPPVSSSRCAQRYQQGAVIKHLWHLSHSPAPHLKRPLLRTPCLALSKATGRSRRRRRSKGPTLTPTSTPRTSAQTISRRTLASLVLPLRPLRSFSIWNSRLCQGAQYHHCRYCPVSTRRCVYDIYAR